MASVDETVEQPAKNGTTDEWKAYAITQGASEADVEDMTRTELIEKYAAADDDASTAVTPEAAKKNAYQAGEAMTAPDAPAAVRAGAETLPPHLRAAAVHRPITS